MKFGLSAILGDFEALKERLDSFVNKQSVKVSDQRTKLAESEHDLERAKNVKANIEALLDE